MSYKVSCQECDQRLEVDDDMVGNFPCPSCSAILSIAAPAPVQAQPEQPERTGPRCQQCNDIMTPKKIHRLSTPVAIIGYIFLIPSIIGIAIGALIVLLGLASGDAATGIFAGGFGLFLALGAFVSGLFGWILVMKKKILKCESCGAVVNAA